jgi:hypothetical protein
MPDCCTVASHEHPPVDASTQVTDEKPIPAKGPPILAHVVVVPESIRHPGGRSTCAVPIVIVPSV